MASQYVKLPLATGGGGGGGDVDSFNGRTGIVVSQAGDYSAGIVSNTPAGTISATTVQGAINELDTNVQANVAAISSLTTVVAGKQPLDADLTAFAGVSVAGLLTRTGAGTAEARSLVAGANIAITNPAGIAGNPSIAFSGVLPVANGGTNLSATPANGQLPIGNGAGYTLAQLTAGSGINVANAAGAITISLASPLNYNVDGGNAASVYGGTTPINGGTA